MIDEEESTYQERVIQGALAAFVAAGSADGAEGGYVDFDAALDGLCDAIATLEAAVSLGKSPVVRQDGRSMPTADHRPGIGIGAYG